MRIGPLSYYCESGFLWFRVFGYGLKLKDMRRHRLLFSERYGYEPYLRIGSWAIGLLK